MERLALNSEAMATRRCWKTALLLSTRDARHSSDLRAVVSVNDPYPKRVSNLSADEPGRHQACHADATVKSARALSASCYWKICEMGEPLYLPRYRTAASVGVRVRLRAPRSSLPAPAAALGSREDVISLAGNTLRGKCQLRSPCGPKAPLAPDPRRRQTRNNRPAPP
jgi:hypothetical protein